MRNFSIVCVWGQVSSGAYTWHCTERGRGLIAGIIITTRVSYSGENIKLCVLLTCTVEMKIHWGCNNYTM